MLSVATTQPSTGTHTVRIQSLLEMSVRGLESMLYPGRNLFSYKLRCSPEGLVKEGVSRRYTIIALLGLQRAAQAGLRPSFDARSIFDDLIRETRWIDNAGDCGLLLWLSALQAPEKLSQLIVRAGLDTLLDRLRDARERRTMEMAWVLAGLAHMRMADAANLPDLSVLAFHTYHLLIQNQGAEGIFAHQARRESYTGQFRGRLGSFADQVYPIYALAKFAQAWGVDEAIRRARICADTLCRLQGNMGQWWWHYDSGSGRMVGKYPVYSVHQDGMAPMAFLALSQASGLDYNRPVQKGLEWIWGKNELGVDMRSFPNNTIWRCICQSALRRYWSELLGLVAGMPHSPGELKVLYECRPYHLGWLLYGFSLENRQVGSLPASIGPSVQVSVARPGSLPDKIATSDKPTYRSIGTVP